MTILRFYSLVNDIKEKISTSIVESIILNKHLTAHLISSLRGSRLAQIFSGAMSAVKQQASTSLYDKQKAALLLNTNSLDDEMELHVVT